MVTNDVTSATLASSRMAACSGGARQLGLVRRVPHDHYVVLALATSPSILVMFALIIGVIGGIVSIPMSLFSGAGLVGAAAVATRFRGVRDYLARKADLRARMERESTRSAEIRRAGPERMTQYDELRKLVEGCERRDPVQSQRLDLEALLEYFVRLATTHARCLEALTAKESLPTSSLQAESVSTKRHAEIQVRREKHRGVCMNELGRIADEIAAVDELVRFVSQRIACAQIDSLIGGEIDRILVDLHMTD